MVGRPGIACAAPGRASHILPVNPPAGRSARHRRDTVGADRGELHDTEQLGGHREDECALKAEHPAHFRAERGELGVNPGFEGGEVDLGIRPERGEVGLGCGLFIGVADGRRDGFGVLALDAGRFEVAGGGERVDRVRGAVS